MEAKEILSQVKLFFNDLINPSLTTAATGPAEAPKEYELKIGGMVTIDKLEAGGVVMIDGSPSLPGDLELVDGTKITVSDNGVISVVTPAAPAELAAPEMDMSAKFTAFETSANEKFTSYEAKFSAYEARFAATETQLAKATKVIDKLLELNTLLVEAPAGTADPAARVGNNFKDQQKEKDLSILFN